VPADGAPPGSRQVRNGSRLIGVMMVHASQAPRTNGCAIDRASDFLALVVLAAVVVIALSTFRDYGLGWDDYTHSEFADRVIAMYVSGFRDTGALTFVNLHMYGSGFDVLAALMHKVLPFGLFETRRLAGAAVGLVGLAAAWRAGRRVGGPVAGLATLVLLAACPVFHGHMFMNPKDAPFAVAMIVLVLALVRLADEYPEPAPRTLAFFGVGAGLAIGTRVLGGIGAIYAFAGLVPLLAADIKATGARDAIRRLGRFSLRLLPSFLLGYLVMGVLWPWSVLSPLNPFRALVYFSKFFEKPWKELFDGALIAVPDMPWTYLPTLFAFKLPEIFSVLACIGVVLAVAEQTRAGVPARRRSAMLIVAFAAFFPLALAMVTHPALYNGVRHFIFVVPPMAVLGGAAFAWMFEWLNARARAAALALSLACVAGLLLPVEQMIRLHPYQYTYFNHAAGTVRAADNRFMLDYWGLSLKQASEALRAKIAERGEAPPAGRKWKVAVCGPQRPAQVALGPEFDIGWESSGADFAMLIDEFYCRRLDAPIIAEIERAGVVFARVHDLRGRDVPTLLSIPAP
jgi:hypothetical protein